MKKILALIIFICVFAPDSFGQTDGMLNLREYSRIFTNAAGSASRTYIRAASNENELNKIAALDGNETSIDTPLEIALLSNAAGVIDVRPVQANEMLGTPRQADLKLGAAVFQEIQILRFLGNTAAVGRHEGILKFITDRGCVTRAQIETFYRNSIRAYVSELVDEQVADLNRNISAGLLTEIKRVITEFMLAPSRTTYNVLLQTYRRYAGDELFVLSRTVGEINYDIRTALINDRTLGQ